MSPAVGSVTRERAAGPCCRGRGLTCQHCASTSARPTAHRSRLAGLECSYRTRRRRGQGIDAASARGDRMAPHLSHRGVPAIPCGASCGHTHEAWLDHHTLGTSARSCAVLARGTVWRRVHATQASCARGNTSRVLARGTPLLCSATRSIEHRLEVVVGYAISDHAGCRVRMG